MGAPASAQIVPPGERIELATRPGAAFVLLYQPGLLLAPIAMLAVWAALRRALGPGLLDSFPWVATAMLAAYVIVGVLSWLSRAYILTDRRLLTALGVLGRAMGDLPLRSVQHIALTRSLIERAIGLGTIGAFAADGQALRWRMVPRPADVVARIRAGADAAARAPARRLPVIGLAGGIGSGKSEAGRILGRLGCAVVDSDARAKEALDEPPVRDRLVEWWGAGVLGPDGRIDRRAVARVVFADAGQRRRLESLVHPVVKRKRDEARASLAGAVHPPAAFVIDAPLLFEAGVDKECDAVWFIDAPREVRPARVASRGWDEAELARREAAQMPLDEKRRRSDEAIVNDGDVRALEERVREALGRVLSLPLDGPRRARETP